MSVTFAQMPGTMTTIEIPQNHQGRYTLRDVLAKMDVDPETIRETTLESGKKRERSLAINGKLVTDLDTEVPDGSTVLLTENIVGG